ncbi:hypothetical protein ACDY96_16660 [Rhizobium mongolense]|uniref:hypothetical protein n=1 Tax=Rhizobium TaxID=379 RepID=UPI0024B14F85|nr:hypothetical protein [Rhizobium sp. CC1099]WFU88863.1 hypothetical protein QA644_07355 [Rhizobium sp. CC1099]
MSEIFFRQIFGVMIYGLPTAILSFGLTYFIVKNLCVRQPTMATVAVSFLIALGAYTLSALFLFDGPAESKASIWPIAGIVALASSVSLLLISSMKRG